MQINVRRQPRTVTEMRQAIIDEFNLLDIAEIRRAIRKVPIQCLKK